MDPSDEIKHTGNPIGVKQCNIERPNIDTSSINYFNCPQEETKSHQIAEN